MSDMNGMTTTKRPEQQFKLCLESPALVGAKDRDGWVGLFHADGFVEDPVEAGRYQGTAAITNFWDVFIGPQPSVGFELERDFFGTRTLIRQATVVSMTEADAHEPLRVPALIVYTLRDDRVGSLRAVWEPIGVIRWFVGRGAAGMKALARHGGRMMRKAGLANAMRFGGTLVRGMAHARAEALVREVVAADPARGPTRLDGAKITIAGPDVEAEFERDAAAAIERLQALAGGALAQWGVDRLVVCGDHVAASLVEPAGPGALAVLVRVGSGGAIEALTAIWSPSPQVLTRA